MGVQDYERFLPGDEVPLRLEIQHPRMRLDEVGVTLAHEERPEIELLVGGQTEPAGNSRVAKLTLLVPAGAMPGLYRVNRMWVTTYGGRVFNYEGEEVAEFASNFAFEVLDEPDEKPELRLSYR